MHAVKGKYEAGSVRLIERAPVQQPSEVLVIFPARAKRVVKIGGLMLLLKTVNERFMSINEK